LAGAGNAAEVLSPREQGRLAVQHISARLADFGLCFDKRIALPDLIWS